MFKQTTYTSFTTPLCIHYEATKYSTCTYGWLLEMDASPCCPGCGGRLPLLVWPHHPPVPASLHQPPAPPHSQGPGRWSQEAPSLVESGISLPPWWNQESPLPLPGAGLCAGLAASLTGDWCLSSLQQLTSQNRTLGLGHTGDSQVRLGLLGT